MPSKVPDGQTRGWIIPIGGAENKENDRRILERFVRASGGEDADIVVIPTASRMHETGSRYEQVFSEIGAQRVTVMDFDTRRDCHEPGRLERLLLACAGKASAEVIDSVIDSVGQFVGGVAPSDDITAMASTKVRLVSVQYITPGPSIMRTAFRSLVARAMMSPVRLRP